MAVKIRRERPDQRRHHRLSAPLHVEVLGHKLRAADWSLGGLRLTDYPEDLPGIGSELEITLTLPFQGFDVSFAVTAEVRRVDPQTRTVAFQFTKMGDRETELIRHFIEELITGSMMEVEDTIQRIDVPVTPASLEPTIKPVVPETVPVRRMPTKTIVMSAFYIVLGFIIFGYAGLLGYTNFFRMEIPTAVISAPVEVIQAQVDGRIDWAGIKPGDKVNRGEVLIRMIDNDLERDIELADIAVKERKAKLIYLQQRHADELEKLRSFASLEMKNVQQAKLEMETTASQLETARRQERRLRHLHDRGFTTDAKLDAATQLVTTLEKRLESRRIELSSRVQLAKNDIGKRFYTGDDLIGKAEQFEAEVALAKNEIKLARQRHLINVKMRQRLSVRAPFDGTILALPRVSDAAVRRGDVVAIVEQRKHREVLAFLNQDEILKVGLGDEAILFIPALGESLQGRVTKIDRTSAFLREQDQRSNPGYSWRGPRDRTAKVTIRFDDPQLVSDYEKYRSGLPVVVVFEQRSTNSLLTSIAQKLSLSL